MGKYFAITLGIIVGVAVYVWSCIMTIRFTMLVFPGAWVEPGLSLALFDVGALAWVLIFVYLSEGLWQKSLALILFFVDFIGMCLTSFGAMWLGGQTLAHLDYDLGSVMIYVYWLWTTVNAFAGFAYPLLHPKVIAAIREKIMEDGQEALEFEAELKRQTEVGKAIAQNVGHERFHNRILGQKVDAEAIRRQQYLTAFGGAQPQAPATHFDYAAAGGGLTTTSVAEGQLQAFITNQNKIIETLTKQIESRNGDQRASASASRSRYARPTKVSAMDGDGADKKRAQQSLATTIDEFLAELGLASVEQLSSLVQTRGWKTPEEAYQHLLVADDEHGLGESWTFGETAKRVALSYLAQAFPNA